MEVLGNTDMNTVVKRMALLATFAWACAFPMGGRAESDDESVLLWLLDDPMIKEVNGGPDVQLHDLVGRGVADGKTANAVRVMALTGDTPTQLSVKTYESETWTSYLALPDVEGGYCAGPAYANLAGFDISNNPTLSFVIEIGNYDGTDWLTLAVSAAANVSELIDDWEAIRSTQLSQYGQLEWTGGTYVVPEPSSGLLLLIGGALMALKRKKLRG